MGSQFKRTWGPDDFGSEDLDEIHGNPHIKVDSKIRVLRETPEQFPDADLDIEILDARMHPREEAYIVALCRVTTSGPSSTGVATSSYDADGPNTKGGDFQHDLVELACTRAKGRALANLGIGVGGISAAEAKGSEPFQSRSSTGGPEGGGPKSSGDDARWEFHPDNGLLDQHKKKLDDMGWNNAEGEPHWYGYFTPAEAAQYKERLEEIGTVKKGGGS